MRKNLEKSTDTCTKRTNRYKVIAILRRFLPLIFQIILTIAAVVFFKEAAPYIKGTKILENPLTTSQMSMMLVTTYVLVMWLYIVKKMRK